MSRLRLVTVLLPIGFIAIVELASDTFLDAALPFPRDTLLVIAVVTIMAILFSGWAFGEIDRLSDTLRRRNAEIEARHAEARGLREVGVAIASMVVIDGILQATADHARTLLGWETAFVILGDGQIQPTLHAVTGQADLLDPAGSQPGDELHRFVRADRANALLAAPLRRGDATLGLLAVADSSNRNVRIEDAEILSTLATQAAVAVENDRLQTELRQVAVQDERERIARELHDGIAQVLGYVNTKSQAVEELLDAQRVPEARAQLMELAAAARSTYVDVREAILGLSSPVAPTGRLTTALRAYARRFAEASKLAVRMEASDPVTRLDLPPAVADEVFRIIREALTNVRKHAAARRVTIRLDVEGSDLVVEVIDDGRGFDPAALGTWAATDAGGRLQVGLIGMRDRTEQAGGHIEWLPTPGGGNTVRLSVPIDGTGAEDGVPAGEGAPASVPLAPGDGAPASAPPAEPAAAPERPSR